MGAIASQITSLTIVYSIFYSDAVQRKHESSASLAFVWGIHRDRWIPRIKGQLRGKCFHLMTHRVVTLFTTLRPRRNGQHFADYIFKRIFFNENVCISIKISLRFVLKGSINTITAFVQIMDWCRSGDKTLSEPTVVSLPTHICVSRHQWVNDYVDACEIYRRSRADGMNPNGT